MVEPEHRRRANSWDPIGFLLMIVLLVVLGAACFYLIEWAGQLTSK